MTAFYLLTQRTIDYIYVVVVVVLVVLKNNKATHRTEYSVQTNHINSEIYGLIFPPDNLILYNMNTSHEIE